MRSKKVVWVSLDCDPEMVEMVRRKISDETVIDAAARTLSIRIERHVFSLMWRGYHKSIVSYVTANSENPVEVMRSFGATEHDILDMIVNPKSCIIPECAIAMMKRVVFDVVNSYRVSAYKMGKVAYDKFTFN